MNLRQQKKMVRIVSSILAVLMVVSVLAVSLTAFLGR